MKVVRQTVLALLVAFAAAGCRTAGVDNLARPEPLVPRTSMDATELIAEHNRNANRVKSFEARPSIKVTSSRLTGSVNGRLAMERPRNFKLELATTLNNVADIGSNDQEFWFWLKDSQEKAVYVCNYDESGTSPLAATLQPDWIVEALGLRVIPEDEAAETTVKPGKDGTLVLTYSPKQGDPGASFVRETVVSESTHRIKQLRVFSADHKTLLAQAFVTDYQNVAVRSDDGSAEEPAYVPKNLRLDWLQEKLSLNVFLKEPKANMTFSEERRALVFVEPKIQGYSRVNLAERPGVANGRGPTTIRETRPVPPAGIKLGEPASLGTDDSARISGDPVAFAPDLPPTGSLTDQIVRPAIPQAPEPEFQRTGNSNRRNGSPFGLEP